MYLLYNIVNQYVIKIKTKRKFKYILYLPPIRKRRSIVHVIKSLVFDPEAYEISTLEGFNFILSRFDILNNSIEHMNLFTC